MRGAGVKKSVTREVEGRGGASWSASPPVPPDHISELGRLDYLSRFQRAGMSPAERNSLIERYAMGPAVLEVALAVVPAGALQWRPAAGKWSAHEVIVHCADSETNAHMRLRYLLGESNPSVMGYDQDNWAIVIDYHAQPLELALATIRAVRANTVPLLNRLSEEQWRRTGRHPEHPSYGVERWLETYAEHLEVHERQIRRNLKAWDGGER